MNNLWWWKISYWVVPTLVGTTCPSADDFTLVFLSSNGSVGGGTFLVMTLLRTRGKSTRTRGEYLVEGAKEMKQEEKALTATTTPTPTTTTTTTTTGSVLVMAPFHTVLQYKETTRATT